MRKRLLFACCTTLVGSLPAQPQPDPSELRQRADALYTEGSYARAHELYGQLLLRSDITMDQARWIGFRHADTQWRSAAATQTADTTPLDEARTALERMVRDVEREADQDRVWAEVQESLGDFWWTRRQQQDWGQAWPYYERALNWWAGHSDLDLARQRYLALVWRCARPPRVERSYRYGWHGNYLPLPVLRNALEIAQSDDDQARAHYLIASTLVQQGGSWEQQARVPAEFDAALALGSKTDWYDDALFNYAQWMEQRGRLLPLAEGGYRNEPDYLKALQLYRRLTREFAKGETRYFEPAQQRITNITEPQLGVSVAHIFLPDSEIQYHLNWRNVQRVDLALYPVDLARDVDLSRLDEGRRNDWLNSINLEGREALKEWTHETRSRDGGPGQTGGNEDQRRPNSAAASEAENHQPGAATLRWEAKLEPGAYVLAARAGDCQARDLVLVTEAAIVVKTSGSQALVYVCHALHGRPLAHSTVTLWTRWREDNRWRTHHATRETDAEGLVVFDLPEHTRNSEVFVAARHEPHQAFSSANSYWQRAERESWKIYAFTDRPAYRPTETAHWKFIVRRHNGSVYSTPAHETIAFDITDPRGSKVKEGQATLNAFGSTWGSLELTAQMPLGEYQVQFWDTDRKNRLGQATLFRLEEYKLPEFKVAVTTPEESNAGVPPAPPRKKTFRLGEPVEAVIQADYYFGGPVANAEVEVLIYQKPFWISWPQPREFPWFYADMDDAQQPWRSGWGGPGQIVKREILKTDATGKATVRFETPQEAGQDFEYRLEARVTDASRREITGSGTVRVTRQRYYVHARAAHNLHRPQDKVTVEFQAQDANRHPVSVEGRVQVTRQYWWEIWLKPDGTEVKGEEIKRLQAQHKLWPPPPERPDQKGWKLKFRGYEQEDILTRTVKTDTNGVAEFSFTPEREGYYRVAWSSDDPISHLPSAISQPIRAETTVWVADNQSTDLGYRHGGVEILADQDTFRVGTEAPVLLAANAPDRHVLFSVEGENLHSYRLVHLTGSVKLIHLAIEEQHVPNIFLGAAMVSDREIFTDTKQVVVPPVKNFLTVEVKPDHEQYQPREDGTLTVTTKNHEGKPVSAEVALSLVDESVFYIQSEYAGDPRQFYFGDKRAHRVQTQSTMNEKRYARFVLSDDDLLPDRDAKAREQDAIWNEEKSILESELRKLRNRMSRYGDPGYPSAAFAYSEREVAQTAVADAMPASAKMAPLAGAAVPGDVVAAMPAFAPSQVEPSVVVRSDFRSTVLWLPEVKTDASGKSTVKVTYPDSVTGWKATARAATAGNQFGIGDATTRTKQPLIVRLQASRFFVVGDEVMLSAVVNNNTDEAVEVQVALEVEGGLRVAQASGLQAAGGTPALRLNIPANSEARADWKATVTQAGEVKLKVTGRGKEFADAMERTYVAHEHGIERFLSKSGKVRGDDLMVRLDIPKERQPESTTLTVQVTPSLAVTMLDALPYLIDYPYGCTEQTMSRFLPAVITAKTLKDLGLQPEDVMGRVFGGIEPQQVAATQPKGKKDLTQLDAMTRAGLERLYDFQQSDGGWGWWKQGESDHWMSAYVVWGLTLAQQAGVEVRAEVVQRGAMFLDQHLVEAEESPDLQAWMLHALAVQKAAEKESGLSQFQQQAFDNLWQKREALNAYTRALFALAAHHFGRATEAKTLIANLENGVKRDERPDTSVLVGGQPSTLNPQPSAGVMGTAHWGEDGVFWRWSEGGVEATAFALRALLTIDPPNKLIEPVSNWLIKNRRGAQWSNTRDTAIVVLALNDYLRTSGELEADLDYEVLVNGTSIAKRKVSAADVFQAPSRFTVDARLLRDGANEIRIRRKGEGPVYFAAEATFFSREEPITAAGNEIFVKREYFKLVGRPTLLKGYVYDQVPLRDGESVTRGERIETVITIEAKNHYEYLVFEDLKPAGFEAVEIRSGESLFAREWKSGAVAEKSAIRHPPSALDFTGRSRWVYQELRDRKVALFLDQLPEGVWELRYAMRAEVPGTFHALPVLGHAMYVPEIRCNGDEVRVTVRDKE